jgi:hypothetical protein
VPDRVFSLGGANGWYGQNLWKVRGFMDLLVGGGLRRGRTHPDKLHEGDALSISGEFCMQTKKKEN